MAAFGQAAFTIIARLNWGVKQNVKKSPDFLAKRRAAPRRGVSTGGTCYHGREKGRNAPGLRGEDMKRRRLPLLLIVLTWKLHYEELDGEDLELLALLER